MTRPPNEPLESYDDVDDPGEILDAPLSDVPLRDMLTVEPTTKVGDVIGHMNARSVGCALVVDDGVLVGIFTERDVLQRVAPTTMNTAAIIIKELMTEQPDTLPDDASVAFALNRMSVEGYRHIPLLDADGSPVGVVGMRDIINWMVELFPGRVLNVPPAPSSHPKTREGA